MKARDARNLIITLIIAVVGVKLVLWISGNYIGNAAGFSDLVKGFTGLGDLMMYGLIALAILLVPYYLSKRSQEKKMANRF